MLYSLYELTHLAVAPVRAMAIAQSALLRSPLNPAAESSFVKSAAAAAEVFEAVTRRYRKPEWRVAETEINGVTVGVEPRTVWCGTWCNLLHFERNKDDLARAGKQEPDPRVLLVAPLSGHYATLLRGTVEAFLPDHEVYITDWVDARMVPVISGRFDLNDYINYVRAMLQAIGPGASAVGVCQPGPPVLAAISLMSEDNDPALPSSMIFMGSPIDARRSPTAPNKLAEERPFEWFRDNMIQTVPPVYPGGFRQVYPGFVQLASFMGMNWSRHMEAHRSYFDNLVKGDGESAEKHREFYDEYLSVLDLTEEFYLQTIRDVFQQHKLPRGILEHEGRVVRPEAIDRVALMTVEGEFDDISGVGQTQAAHDICRSIPESMRIDYLQPGVGHYGVFNGRRFRTEIYPRMRDFIAKYAGERGGKRRKAAA